MTANLLVCDDEDNVRRFLEIPFRKRGYNVFTAPDGRTAVDILAAEAIDVLILDINLPDINGLQLLEQVGANKDLVTVIITAYEDVRTAVEAMKKGAFDYITKPFEFSRLENIVEKASDL